MEKNNKIEIKHEINNNPIITGIRPLDHVLGGGLHRGELTVVAGRLGMGKSAFMMELMLNACREEGIKATAFSLEMSRDRYKKRLMELDDKASEMLDQKKITIDDTIAITIDEIERKCREKKTMNGISLVIIDYFYLIGREQEFDMACRGLLSRLKRLAKEIGVAIVLDIELMKTCEYRENPHPKLQDIRWESFLRHTDYILMLHRDSYYDSEIKDKDKLEIVISELPYTDFFTRTIDVCWPFPKGYFD